MKVLRFWLVSVTIWSLASGLAFLRFCRPLSHWPGGVGPLAVLGLCLILTPLFEATVFSLVASSIASVEAPGVRMCLRTIFALTATLGLTAIACGWWVRAHSTGFLQAAVLRSALQRFDNFQNFMSGRDFLLLGLAVAAALAASTIGMWLAPVLNRGQGWCLAATAAASFAGMAVALQVVPRMAFDSENVRLVQAVFRGAALPSATLAWGPLLVPPPSFPWPERVKPRTPIPHLNNGAGRPNILMVVVESLREGEDTRAMPTLARLGTEGIRFTRAYAPGNETYTSTTGFLTSLEALKFPQRDSFRWEGVKFERFYDGLTPAYRTGYFSSFDEKWQDLKSVSKGPSLDRFFDASSMPQSALPVPLADTGFSQAIAAGTLKNGSLDDGVTTRAFQQWVTESRVQPFFAVVGYQSSHYPYQQGLNVPQVFTPSQLSADELARCSFFSYPMEFVERMHNRYWNSLHYLDGLIAENLAFLQRNGLIENTVVIVLGDHGELFGEGGELTHANRIREAAVHSPLVVWGSHLWTSGVYSDPVSLLDVGPMVFELAGLSPYEGFQGHVPDQLSGKRVERPIFSSAMSLTEEDSVAVGKWRLTQARDQRSPSRLYDVTADPAETRDQSSSNPSVVKCLEATLRDFQASQLGYYANPARASEFFPPQHPLADIPECAALHATP